MTADVTCTRCGADDLGCTACGAQGTLVARPDAAQPSRREAVAMALFAWDTEENPHGPTWDGLSDDQRGVWLSGADAALAAQRPEGVTLTEWRVLHGGGGDGYIRNSGTDEHNAREAARIWGGRVQSQTITTTEWAEVSGDTETACAHRYPDGTACHLRDHSAPGLAAIHGIATDAEAGR